MKTKDFFIGKIFRHIAYLILHAFLKARNQLQPTIYKTKDQIIKNRKEQADLLSDLVARYIEKYYHRIGEKISMRLYIIIIFIIH